MNSLLTPFSSFSELWSSFFNFWKWETSPSGEREQLAGRLPLPGGWRGGADGSGWDWRVPGLLKPTRALLQLLPSSQWNPWAKPSLLGGVDCFLPPAATLPGRRGGEREGETGRSGRRRGGERGSFCLYTSAPRWGGGGVAGLRFSSLCEQRSAVGI